MIEPEWRRIAGMQVQDDGDIALVWMAHDKTADKVHIYDCCVFRREVLAVIAEGINCRGRWVPVAWSSKAKDVSEKLLERGCNMLPEPVRESQQLAEVQSRDILERMKTHRLKVDRRLQDWLDESRRFYRQDSQVPLSTSPLMAATRHAFADLQYARRQRPPGKKERNYPQVAMI